MWLIALKGLSGSGKSTLGRALSKQLGWPLIDKDDVKDLLDGYKTEAGGLAYDIMFNIARRQLLQGLNVICDSPLVSSISYQSARKMVTETSASLAVIECRCSDERLWNQRIDVRKALQLPRHHQTDWDAFKSILQDKLNEGNYQIIDPLLIVDTVKPFQECLVEINDWIEQLFESAPDEYGKSRSVFEENRGALTPAAPFDTFLK
jgi:predicted kinase